MSSHIPDSPCSLIHPGTSAPSPGRQTSSGIADKSGTSNARHRTADSTQEIENGQQPSKPPEDPFLVIINILRRLQVYFSTAVFWVEVVLLVVWIVPQRVPDATEEASQKLFIRSVTSETKAVFRSLLAESVTSLVTCLLATIYSLVYWMFYKHHPWAIAHVCIETIFSFTFIVLTFVASAGRMAHAVPEDRTSPLSDPTCYSTYAVLTAVLAGVSFAYLSSWIFQIVVALNQYRHAKDNSVQELYPYNEALRLLMNSRKKKKKKGQDEESTGQKP
ncbi:hypothetical protein F5Y19DRAFT_484461 [Xylariaceae sp. FL1651]|nr:hypothetical protein F5Y19DRAFT_484461 [Xylariaceae sp. FL1651]